MSKKPQAGGQSMKDALRSAFATSTILISLVISFLIYKYVMGSPINFEGGADLIKNKVPASIPKFPVAATQPNIKGIAPGKAPTKTDKEVIVFNGVYMLVYKNMEIAPNIADFGLIL